MAATEKIPQTAASGRHRNVSLREARAAARVKVTIDERRGRPTAQWIKDLAKGNGKTA